MGLIITFKTFFKFKHAQQKPMRNVTSKLKRNQQELNLDAADPSPSLGYLNENGSKLKGYVK